MLCTKAISALLCGALLVGCGGVSGGTPPGETPAGGRAFRIVGYVTAAAVVDVIDFTHLTHVNYAFLLPKKSGNLRALGSSAHLDRVTAATHAAGAKVLISVGGWGSDAEFVALAASVDHRARFVSALVDFVAQHRLDGADIDWEYPSAGTSSANFVSLMRELRAALPTGSLLTAAVIADATQADGIDPAVFGLVDFVNIMAYDGSPADHSPISLAQQALVSWAAKGLPKEQRVLGVPFFARPGDISYRKLLESDAAAAGGDRILYFSQEQNYNGPATLRAKVALAKGDASGIMIWELSQDALGGDSLLKVIWEAAQ
jgi:GH18 family chitinase